MVGLACLVGVLSLFPVAGGARLGAALARLVALAALQVSWTSAAELLPTERRVAGMCAVFALTQVVAATAPADQSITATSLLNAGGCFVGAAAAAGLPPSAFSLRDTVEMRAPKAREAEGVTAV